MVEALWICKIICKIQATMNHGNKPLYKMNTVEKVQQHGMDRSSCSYVQTRIYWKWYWSWPTPSDFGQVLPISWTASKSADVGPHVCHLKFHMANCFHSEDDTCSPNNDPTEIIKKKDEFKVLKEMIWQARDMPHLARNYQLKMLLKIKEEELNQKICFASVTWGFFFSVFREFFFPFFSTNLVK